MFNIKISMYLGQWWSLFWRGTIEPISLFGLLLLVVIFYFIFKDGGVTKVMEESVNHFPPLKAFFIAIVIWTALNIGIAAIRTPTKIAEVGTFNDNGFAYHEPRHIFTTTLGSKDDQTLIEFRIPKNVPIGAELKINAICDGGIAKIGPANVRPMGTLAQRKLVLSFPVNQSRTAKLGVVFPKNSDPTTVRIYMQNWKLNEN